MCTSKYVLRDIAGAASNIHEEGSLDVYIQIRINAISQVKPKFG